MQYFYEENGVKAEVQPEVWQWVVIYKDGTVFKQFGDDGVFHRIGEIDQPKINQACLINIATGKKINLVFTKGMKLIHKYRNAILNAHTPEERKVKTYIWGWKKGSGHMIMQIMETGDILVLPHCNG